MSASAIIDSVIEMVGAASFMGPDNVARDYRVIESVSGSAMVVEILGLEQFEQTFGTALHQDDWTLSVRMFSKDTGDPAAIGARTACMVDMLAATVRADPTLQGTVERTARLVVERELPPDGFVVAGGATWQEAIGRMEVEEWPDG